MSPKSKKTRRSRNNKKGHDSTHVVNRLESSTRTTFSSPARARDIAGSSAAEIDIPNRLIGSRPMKYQHDSGGRPSLTATGLPEHWRSKRSLELKYAAMSEYRDEVDKNSSYVP